MNCYQKWERMEIFSAFVPFLILILFILTSVFNQGTELKWDQVFFFSLLFSSAIQNGMVRMIHRTFIEMHEELLRLREELQGLRETVRHR